MQSMRGSTTRPRPIIHYRESMTTLHDTLTRTVVEELVAENEQLRALLAEASVFLLNRGTYHYGSTLKGPAAGLYAKIQEELAP
jgi:hypothetical protein